jgi:hypothetical protein
MILSWRGQVKLGNCSQWDVGKGLWVGTKKQDFWVLSSTFIMKMQVLEKLITYKAADHFTCCFVSSHSMGSHCDGTVLQVISAVPLMWCVWGEVSRTGWKCHHVIMLQATQWTPLRMFCGSGGGKWYNIVAVLVTSFHMSVVWFSNMSSRCYGKQFTSRDNIVPQFRLRCIRWCQRSILPSTLLAVNPREPWGTILKVDNCFYKRFSVRLFHMFIWCTSVKQQNQEFILSPDSGTHINPI